MTEVTGSVCRGIALDVTSLDAINQPEKLGKTVVIIGGGLVGCEIALDAANRGKDVTVVEALDDIMAAGGAGAPYPNKQMIGDLFESKNVTVLTGTKLSEVTDEGAVVTAPDGDSRLLKADTVISAMGFKPAANLKDDLAALNVPVCEVGDATGAGTIMKAIWDAYDAANSL